MNDEVDVSAMVGVPDPDADYFARVVFGRTGTDEKPEKVYLDFTYPSLPYGAMVGIQKLLQEVALPELVAQGELVAEMMGQPVMGVQEVRDTLAEMRGNRGKGQGQGPKK